MGSNWSLSSSAGTHRVRSSSAFTGTATAAVTVSSPISSFRLLRNQAKRRSPLVTIRKLIRLHRRRNHSNQSYVRAFAEMATKWTTLELSQLVETFESTLSLRELYVAALTAHPAVKSLSEDLGNMQTACCLADFRLCWRGVAYPVHKSILCVRSALLKKEIAREPSKDFVALEDLVRHPEISSDDELAHNLLALLYMDRQPLDVSCSERTWNIIKEHYGVAGSLQNDIAKLRDSSLFCDAVLTFVKTNGIALIAGATVEDQNLGSYTCHQVVLAARSSFFRNLLLRKSLAAGKLSDGDPDCRDPVAPVSIVLDDAVISHRFGKLLLKVLYEDLVDLSCIVEQRVAASSLSEARAMVSGGRSSCGSVIDDSMELYHVGKFLDLSSLIYGAETLIVDNLTLENVASVLAWALEPSGSSWVRRRCLLFIEECFMKFVHTPGFVNLDSESLRRILLSDYLQAPEMEVLSAVIHWSEYQLVRQREMREPNLLANTAHSIARRAIRRRDFTGAELNGVVCEFLPLIRIGHLLPSASEVLASVTRRGITLGVPTSCCVRIVDAGCGYCPTATASSCARSWLSSCGSSAVDSVKCPGHGRPRAYLPFYQEAKRLLHERTHDASSEDGVRLHRPRHSSVAVGDSDNLLALQDAVTKCAPPTPGQPGFMPSPILAASKDTRRTLDKKEEFVSRGTDGHMQLKINQRRGIDLADDLSVLHGSEFITDALTRVGVLLRQKLVRTVLSRRADRATVLMLVCLWAVHEADLPDEVVGVLQSHIERALSSSCDQTRALGQPCSWHCSDTQDEHLNCGTSSSTTSSGSIGTCSHAKRFYNATVPDVASSLSSLECGSSSLRKDMPGPSRHRICSTWAATASNRCCPDITVSNHTCSKWESASPSGHNAASCYSRGSASGDLPDLFPDVTLHSHSGSSSED